MLLIGVIYFAVVFFAALPDHLIIFPSTNRIDPKGAIRKAIPFENGELEVWTSKSKLAQQTGHPEIYVLRFYGNADRAERWIAAEADSWNGRAIEIWGMNYPGFGGSTGPAKLRRIGPAAMAAFDALRLEAKDKPIVIFAASLGTTGALHVAANREVKGLVLHNPPAIRQMILQRFGWWNLWLLAGPLSAQIPNDLDSVSNAKKINKPAIFLLAENDEVVPPHYQHMVVDAYAGEKHIINLRGAHHNSPMEGAALTDLHRELDWLLPRSGNQ